MKTNTLCLSLISLLTYFSLSPKAQAVIPAPDGGYPGGNTAEGQKALLSLTTGGFNTAIGFLSLSNNSTNQLNTAVGAGTLLVNTADQNTATGAGALLSNTTGDHNTAQGAFALFNNTAGRFNTANGAAALFSNTTGNGNTATGDSALNNNTEGYFNTAAGDGALGSNTAGHNNTAIGVQALTSNTTGNSNAATGDGALIFNTTGSGNIALGSGAGSNLTTGDNNIDVGNAGVSGDSGTIRIGDDNHNGATFIAGVYGMSVSGLAVAMDSSGHLGTVGSSSRFKKEIRPMAETSEAILALKPVTFRYKKEIDPTGAAQFGLVAEEVEKVDPDLVVRDRGGKPYTVRYDQVNAMLLNEFLKEHRTVQEQKATVAELRQNFARQQKQIEALTTVVQKVSAQLQLSKTAPQTVVNNQ